jgi:fructosamine-3-kinase
MILPVPMRGPVERALSDLGLGRGIVATEAAGGGCINNGARIESDVGASFFLKWNAQAPAGLFEAEADGLEALRSTGAVRVPEPRAWGAGDAGGAWLLLEHVPPGPAARDAEARLGTGLALIHASGGRSGFGWGRDNWIGSLPQSNPRTSSWGEFWRDRRLLPQLEMARARGRARDPVFDRLVEVVPHALADVSTPGLVHGDLWSGNAYTAATGEPVIIDPAVYEGHGEVDLAMTGLFGGFSPAFYDAYRDARGIPPAFDAYRKDLYQLYYLLAHVNMFGGSYEAGCLRAARRVVAALA